MIAWRETNAKDIRAKISKQSGDSVRVAVQEKE